MSDSYSASLFPNYSTDSKIIWVAILNFAESIGFNLEIASLVVSIIGIICNIFHLIVLSQKSMRGLTINAFLIGIAFCDLLRMICVVFVVAPLVYLFNIESDQFECLSPQWYSTMVISVFSISTEKTCQQLSVWFGVTIAILRALVIRNPLNTKISRFIDSKYGCRPLFLITAIIFPFWTISYFQMFVSEYQTWTAPPECTNFPPNYTQTKYFYETITIFGQDDKEFTKIELICEGIICKLIPCILLPFATILLIGELRKTKSESLVSRKNTDSSKRSTKLVIFMTISFLIGNLPLGLLYLAEFFIIDASLGIVYIMRWLSSTFTLINVINGTIHFLICFFMSSHYRSTAKTLFIRDAGTIENEVTTAKIKSANSAKSVFAVSSTKIE